MFFSAVATSMSLSTARALTSIPEPGVCSSEGDEEMTDRKNWKAELILNGPKGFAFAEVQVPITPWGVEAAAACVNNIYNEMPEPTKEKPCEDR